MRQAEPWCCTRKAGATLAMLIAVVSAIVELGDIVAVEGPGGGLAISHARWGGEQRTIGQDTRVGNDG